MNQAQFTELIESTLASTSALLICKGAEYASDNDRLDNFKKNAALLGLSPLQVWSVYAFKHVDAIQSYMRRIHSGEDSLRPDDLQFNITAIDLRLSEPIEGRFHDAINYLFLGLAILHEIKNPPEVKPVDKIIGHRDDDDEIPL